MIRFSPRKAGSVWSAVNIAKVAELIRGKRMRRAGMAAFKLRRENRSGIYSYEQRTAELPEPYAGLVQTPGSSREVFCRPACVLSQGRRMVGGERQARSDACTPVEPAHRGLRGRAAPGAIRVSKASKGARNPRQLTMPPP